MVAMIRTIFCFIHVMISMLICTPFGILAMILGLFRLRRPKAFIMYLTGWVWARLILLVIGCKPTVTGRENIPRAGGVCIVSNHGSFFDIPLLMAYSGRILGFVAKKELIYVPFLDIWISMLGGLFIDRKNPRKGLKTINKGIKRIKAGGAMLIFPEGHRSHGQGLLPFHPGSLKLATQSGAVIVPVAVNGSYDLFERNHRVHFAPVRITFCKPINTADIPPSSHRTILADQIYGVIKEALEAEITD
jgi:1-acyl-sn-glycerol-3-phosphate acyltransferase